MAEVNKTGTDENLTKKIFSIVRKHVEKCIPSIATDIEILLIEEKGRIEKNAEQQVREYRKKFEDAMQSVNKLCHIDTQDVLHNDIHNREDFGGKDTPLQLTEGNVHLQDTLVPLLPVQSPKQQDMKKSNSSMLMQNHNHSKDTSPTLFLKRGTPDVLCLNNESKADLIGIKPEALLGSDKTVCEKKFNDDVEIIQFAEDGIQMNEKGIETSLLRVQTETKENVSKNFSRPRTPNKEITVRSCSTQASPESFSDHHEGLSFLPPSGSRSSTANQIPLLIYRVKETKNIQGIWPQVQLPVQSSLTSKSHSVPSAVRSRLSPPLITNYKDILENAAGNDSLASNILDSDTLDSDKLDSDKIDSDKINSVVDFPPKSVQPLESRRDAVMFTEEKTSKKQNRTEKGNIKTFLNSSPLLRTCASTSHGEETVFESKAKNSATREAKNRIKKRVGWHSRKGREKKRLAVGLSQSQLPINQGIPGEKNGVLLTTTSSGESVKPQKSTIAQSNPTVLTFPQKDIGFRALGVDAIQRLRIEKQKHQNGNIRTRVPLGQRSTATGLDCSQCRHFYKALNDGGSQNVSRSRSPSGCSHPTNNIEEVSRHRFHQLPPATPPGFWDLSFPPTPKRPLNRD